MCRQLAQRLCSELEKNSASHGHLVILLKIYLQEAVLLISQWYAILTNRLLIMYLQRLYNPNTDTWEADIPLSNSVPNTGLAELVTPDYEVLDQTALRLGLIKVSLSTTSSNGVALPAVALRKISRFVLTFVIKKVVTDILKRAVCDIWQNTDGGVNNNRLPPCPCNLEQMNSDLDRYTKERPFQFFLSKYYFKKYQATSCYRQSNVGYATILSVIRNVCLCNRSFSNSQQCCYDSNGQLLTGVGGGSAYSVYPNNWRSTIGM